MGPDLEKHDDTKLQQQTPAPGRPGIKPSWETGAKTAVGTAVSSDSRVWFTIAQGHLTEIYFPDVDRANTRFVKFLVAADDGFFSDEATDAQHRVEAILPGVPAYNIHTKCVRNRYRIEKEIITDPACDVLIMSVRFCSFDSAENLRLYVFSNSHVGDEGADNSGWVGVYKGVPMLFAQRGDLAYAIACSTGFSSLSAGFMGVSDGFTELHAHGRLIEQYTIAAHGNVALTGEIDRPRNGEFKLVIAFGGNPAEAGLQARMGLSRDFEAVRKTYVTGWQEVQSNFLDLSRADDHGLFRVSTAVSRVVESKRFRGAFVASLSVPWGFDRGDKDIGGYHLIWPRDLAQTVLGLLACGDAERARRALLYLECTQDSDGRWNQNQWLDGTQHWTSKQIDETAIPLLLADALRRADQLKGHNPWPTLKKTAAFLLRHGPVSEQDRWEQTSGYATFTMAVEVAALLAAADFAELHGQVSEAEFLRATADAWNDAVDELTYVSGTELARRCGVRGYYVRLTPPDAILGIPLDKLTIDLTNHSKGKQTKRAVDIVSPDALALVRYGLRAADDPRILDTAKVIDATLKITTKTGPVWRRYTDDGYGEHEDGAPFQKTGTGRGWPLLAGERAHYEIAKGDLHAAEELRRVIANQTSECGMIPEQIWDAEDIPERNLYNGRPSGSGMPLAWAHAEYIQLLRSLRDNKVWSTPPQTIERYVKQRKTAGFQIWTPNQQRGRLRAGKNLRVDLAHEATVEWSIDCSRTKLTEPTQNCGFGVHCTLLKLAGTEPGTRVQFRIRGREGQNDGCLCEILISD